MKVHLEPEDLDALATAIAERLRRDDLLGLKELGVSVRTARAAIQSGELRAAKCGREYRVTRADRDAWVAARRVQPRVAVPVRKSGSVAERAIERARSAGKLRSIGGGGS